jgi:peptidyl-tRNA hydrolase, PTH1 family
VKAIFGLDAVMAKRQALDGEPVLVVKPTTFMNLSGQAVGEIVRYYRIAVADALIVLDEIQLPLGRLRARARGSAGGHNGLRSVIEHLGPEVPRLRLGVGRGDARRDLADHVLARFDAEEAAEVERMIARAADAAEVFVAEGIAAVMNRFNGGDPATTE